MRLCTTPKQIKTTAHNFASTTLLKKLKNKKKHYFGKSL